LLRRVLSRWLIWILLVPFFLWGASAGISLVIQHSRLQRQLTARLAAAFGRPVEVGRYDFSFWGGPVLEAQSVTIGEDPRFGREYFLRADSMAVRLRWQSLLRGRLELGTLSLTRPSLNLVRNATGEWNLAEWLPRPAGMPAAVESPSPSPAAFPALRFRRIEVDAGRINFKRGDEKLPLAFVGVSGAVETDRPGRWRIGLEATPWRAAVIVQQAGTMYVSGHVGGTSSRLRPAALDVAWMDASVSDVLRLVRGDDYGIRGALALALSARTREQGDGWAVQGRAELRQIHRWDLALRPDNPSLNLIVRTEWRPSASSVDLTDVVLEAPHSIARASGRFSWNRAGILEGQKSPLVEVTVPSARVDLGDLLAWVRAFHPGVAESLSVRGLADVRADLSGWPPQIVNATLASEGADFSGPALRRPAHLGQLRLRYNRGIASFLPVTLSWGAPAGPSDGSFRIDMPAKPAPNTFPAWHVAGNASQMRDLIAMAGAFGWNLARGWDLAGPLRCDLRFEGAPYPWPAETSAESPLRSMAWPVGWIEFGTPGASGGGASLRAPFLNQPIEQIKARADLRPGARHIALGSAQAFGTHWSGSFERRETDPAWQFALSGDRLVAADLDRWLNPRWRESFLGRMLPFLSPRTPANVEPENLATTGRLNLGQFTLGSFDVRRLQGDLKIAGRRVEWTNAAGEFYHGTLGGSFHADVNATPVYRANLNFGRVDLSALAAESPQLAGLFGGSASGEISFDARGATRADLVASLRCQGDARFIGAELRSINLAESLRQAARRPGTSAFREASSAFTCRDGKVQFQTLVLSGPAGEINGSGSVDFNRNLDFRLRLLTRPAADARAAGVSGASEVTYRLSGPLASPQVARISAAPPRRPR
jgi:hypothetical protein